ncbi:hypothetical protein, partial [Nocardia africana]
PNLLCQECGQPAEAWHDAKNCGCRSGNRIEPCGHNAGTTTNVPLEAIRPGSIPVPRTES